MVSIPAPAQALLGSDAVAHVWTMNPDGSPQISVVWVIVQGDEVLFGCDGSSRKARNLRQDPQIILSIEDDERNARGFQRHLVIRGRATIEELAIFDPLYLGTTVEAGGAGSWMHAAGGGGVRVACGRMDPGEVDFHAAVTAKRADVIQPDLRRIGGIWEMRKIAVMAEQHDVALAPTGQGGPVALASSLHVGFAASGVLLQETADGMSRNAGVTPADYLRSGGTFAMSGGSFEPNGRPGLGIEVDEEMVRELHEEKRWGANPVWRDDLEAAVGW